MSVKNKWVGFQFLLGRLKTKLKGNLLVNIEAVFQFLLGRLKTTIGNPTFAIAFSFNSS